MSKQPKQVAERMYEAMSSHDVDAFGELLAEDIVNHGMQGQGREQSKQELAYWLSAFPDLELTVEHLVCSGDLVAARYTGRGTHGGDLGPISATGRAIEIAQADVLRIEDGRVAEGWYLPDLYALFLQLGVVADQFGAGAEAAAK